MKVNLQFYDEEESIQFIGLYVAVDLVTGKILRNEFEDPYCDTDSDSLYSFLHKEDYNNFAAVLVHDPEDFSEEEDDESGSEEEVIKGGTKNQNVTRKIK